MNIATTRGQSKGLSIPNILTVARIAAKLGHCAIFSEADGDRHQMDKINVAPCYRSDGQR